MKKMKLIAAAAAFCVSLTGCSFLSGMNKKQMYTDYVEAVLDCSYFNITDNYLDLVEATPEEAQETYEAQAEYVAWLICDYKAVEMDYLSDDTYYGYIDLAKEVMKKAKYEVQPAVKSGNTYHVTVSAEPMDFMEITYDPVADILDEFNDRYAAFDYSDMDALEEDPEYLALEDEYGQRVLDVLYACLDEISYDPPQNVIVEIEVDDDGYYGVSDKSWYDIDDLILGIDENA